MAGSTTNIGLIKPTYSEDADVAIINENMDTLDSTISALDNGLAIVSNNNTHGAITAGQYVYVRNHESLAEGMYTANSNIAANATLSSSNLTVISSGSLNKLNSEIAETYDTSVAGISAFRVLDNITIWLGSGLTISADGKTANQLIPSGYRPYFISQFLTKVYNGSDYVDCIVTFNPDGKITFATLFSGAISGIQTNFLATKTYSYMRNPNA